MKLTEGKETSRFEVRLFWLKRFGLSRTGTLDGERVGGGLLVGTEPYLALDENGHRVLAEFNLRHCASEVLAVAGRLAKSVGHWSQHSMSLDTDTGVEVRRV